MKIVSHTNPRIYLDFENESFARPSMFKDDDRKDMNYHFLFALTDLLYRDTLLPSHERQMEIHITHAQIEYLMKNDFKEHFEIAEEKNLGGYIFVPPIGKITFVPLDPRTITKS